MTEKVSVCKNDLKKLRKLIQENPMCSAVELALLAGWDLKYTQRQVSYVVSDGSVKSLPKRYVIAEANNVKQLRSRQKLNDLIARKEKEKQSTEHTVSTAINNRSELARAWG